MDPNLLPENLRGQEGKEQARLKKQPVGFGLAGLLGRPASPIINYSNLDKKPDVAAKPIVAKNIAWKLPTQNLAKETKFIAHKKAGDSWPEIFKNMFGLGRKKRIDFRLASFAPMPENSRPVPLQPEFVPYRAIVAPKSHSAPAKKEYHEKKHDNKSAYHAAPKRERISEVNVNLMPQELLSRLSAGNAGNIKSLIYAVILPVAIITIGFGAIKLLQNDLKLRMEAKQVEFKGLQQQIGDFIRREEKNNQVADRVAAIKKLLDEKLVWSNFFAKLEKYTIDGVYFSNLTADTSGVLTLPGVADDYDVLAQQLAVLREATDFIKDVKLTNAQLVSEGKAGVIGVGFQLRVTLKDNIFKKTAIAK